MPVVKTLPLAGGGFLRILKTPDVREKILKEGAEPVGNSPEEFAAFLMGIAD